ncbi:MAG: hypothetical protein UU06_C0006G0002 [Parcubacteria group bacterium GW2011_GWB1_40_5]|nr:MAG: hypothetical protein UU06_C0006G0002 [Parcubacteria group bacterium GW2011_GWB1_40_5]
MNTRNSILMKQARESLSGKWGLAIGTMFVYALITMAVQSIPKAGGLLGILITGPLNLGLIIFSLSISRNQNPRFEQPKSLQGSCERKFPGNQDPKY